MVDLLRPYQVRRPCNHWSQCNSLHSTPSTASDHVMDRASSIMTGQLTISASSVLVLHGLLEVLLKWLRKIALSQPSTKALLSSWSRRPSIEGRRKLWKESRSSAPV